MKLADEITITIGGEVITLRPCLRFAIRLERREGSFARLMRDVADGSFTAAVEILSPHHSSPSALLLATGANWSDLKYPMIAYIGQCTCIEPEDVAADAAPAKGQTETITFAEHLLGLYRIGTGWMGWTPAETLDATPAEIREAYKGRMEMLRSIFGSGDATPKTKGDWGAGFAVTARARAKKGEA